MNLGSAILPAPTNCNYYVNAYRLVDVLLESVDFPEEESKDYVFGAHAEETWMNPASWMFPLRELGFVVKKEGYDAADGQRIEYWMMKKDIVLRSGEKLKIAVSGYTQPEMEGKAAINIYWVDPSRYNSSGEEIGVWDSRPFTAEELPGAVADILRRLKRVKVAFDWRTDRNRVKDALTRALKGYEYRWE